MTETSPPSSKVLANRCPSPGAIRQQRFRQRQKLGVRVISVEQDDGDIERLIDAGKLKECEALDSRCIAGAIRSVVKSLAVAEK